MAIPAAHAAFADAEGGGGPAAAVFNRHPSAGGAVAAPAAPMYGSDGYMSVASSISAMGTPQGSMMSGSIGGAAGSGSQSASGGMSSSSRHRPYIPVDSYEEDSVNDAPLLHELGVDFKHIAAKVSSVLHPMRRVEADIMADADMAGPIVFCVVLGFLLLLAGKVHFGYIYGFGGFGVTAMYLMLNLMSSPAHPIDFSRTFSVLGYCLLPILGLAALAVVADLRGAIGAALGLVSIVWCAWSATRFFEAAMHMQQQRWLIAFPSFLLYSCFVLITVF